MKKLYIISLGLFLLGTASFAQKVSRKNADKLFTERKLDEAAAMYEELPEKDQYVLQNLGDAYYFMNQMQEAADQYERLFEEHAEVAAPEYRFRYAHSLRSIGDHEAADRHFSEYFDQNIDFEQWRQNTDSLAPYVHNSRKTVGDSESTDFAVRFLNEDQVVFTSSRNKNRPIYEWSNEPYLDLYIAQHNQASLSNIRLLPGDINTDTHESSATFNQEGNIMYFDRTNSKRVRDEEENNKVAHISIYRAELVDGEWTNAERLPFSSNEYTTEHPSLSADGTKLYFASNMPGSMGSYDIFVVDIHEDGSFGKPQNLGPGVNTPEREQFPFISEEDVLYFSSNGRLGYGELDIFRSVKNNDEFEEAQNLGADINSSFDDFAYTYRPSDGRGFFTSYRDGSESLFSFAREDRERTSAAPEEIVERNQLTGAEQLRDIADIYFDFDKAEILPEAEQALDKVVDIMKEYPDLRIEIGSHADVRGTDAYNQRLSERRAQATRDYILSQGIQADRVTAKGYGESMPLNRCSKVEEMQCSEEEHAVNRRSEFKVLN